MPRYLDHCRAQGWGGAIVDDHSGPRGRVRLQAGVSWAWIHSDESIMAIAAHVYAPAAADASGQIAEPKQARFLTFGSSIPCRELFHFFSPSQDTISSGPFLGTFPSPWPCGSLHLALCPLSSHASALPRETFFSSTPREARAPTERVGRPFYPRTPTSHLIQVRPTPKLSFASDASTSRRREEMPGHRYSLLRRAFQ